MLKTRTKFLLVVMFMLGLGIGVFSGWSDGIYSAVCLFFLPILVALAGAAILSDFSASTTTSPRQVIREAPVQSESPRNQTAVAHTA